METGILHRIGILAASHYKNGSLILQPLGGAAVLTDQGVSMLSALFGVTQFHQNKEGKFDARFIVDDRHLEKVLDLFSKRDEKVSDVEPSRELLEELTVLEFPANSYGLPAIPPVLTADDVLGMRITFDKTVRQKFSDHVGTSTLAMSGVPSRRLFNLFTVHLSQVVFKKLCKWPAIRILTDEEVATTERGAHKGRSREGIRLADNFI